MLRYIHYFSTKKIKYVILSTGPQPIGEKIIVSRKKEARQIIKNLGVKPYNF